MSFDAFIKRFWLAFDGYAEAPPSHAESMVGRTDLDIKQVSLDGVWRVFYRKKRSGGE